MIEAVELRMRQLDSLDLIDRYEILLELSSEILVILSGPQATESLPLAKSAMREIHGLRYRMAYNKATDRGEFDKRLKEAWGALRDAVAVVEAGGLT